VTGDSTNFTSISQSLLEGLESRFLQFDQNDKLVILSHIGTCHSLLLVDLSLCSREEFDTGVRRRGRMRDGIEEKRVLYLEEKSEADDIYST